MDLAFLPHDRACEVADEAAEHVMEVDLAEALGGSARVLQVDDEKDALLRRAAGNSDRWRGHRGWITNQRLYRGASAPRGEGGNNPPARGFAACAFSEKTRRYAAWPERMTAKRTIFRQM